MNANEAGSDRVTAVLLADGWHRIVPSSFSVGPLGFGSVTDVGVRGFRFEETNAGSPYQPTVLAGPLDSIIAVRQVASRSERVGDLDRARAARYGHQPDEDARRTVRAGH
jgi:hypothetical protein